MSSGTRPPGQLLDQCPVLDAPDAVVDPFGPEQLHRLSDALGPARLAGMSAPVEPGPAGPGERPCETLVVGAARLVAVDREADDAGMVEREDQLDQLLGLGGAGGTADADAEADGRTPVLLGLGEAARRVRPPWRRAGPANAANGTGSRSRRRGGPRRHAARWLSRRGDLAELLGSLDPAARPVEVGQGARPGR